MPAAPILCASPVRGRRYSVPRDPARLDEDAELGVVAQLGEVAGSHEVQFVAGELAGHSFVDFLEKPLPVLLLYVAT